MPGKISRSKIELSRECPRCFWLDVHEGVKRPPPAPYTINNAIDYLLKQDFDAHRKAGTQHPIIGENKIDAIPFNHPDIDKWRHNFTGVRYEHEPTRLTVFGAVDDVWVTPKEELIVVDYKATGANQHHIYESYGRQMEVYQWLLRRNGFNVLPTGYFVFARVDKGNGFAESFEKGKLPFNIIVEGYAGNDEWVEEAIVNAKNLMDADEMPAPGAKCEYCVYREAASRFA